jgi:hypothetical protein
MRMFIELATFSKYREDYFDDDQFAQLQRALDADPDAGDVVPATGGVRKLRWARAGMGKRGGLRVLYYVQDRAGRIWLLTVYSKSARENISAGTLNALREIVDATEIR